MNLLRLFGIGSDKILSQGICVPGTVTKVYQCWWLSIKVKPVRICATPENTKHPHIITFSYTVDGAAYEGKLYIPYRYRVPPVGTAVSVYYDPEQPRNYACYAFGPSL